MDALGIFGIAGSGPAILASAVGLWIYETVSPLAFFLVTLATAVVSIAFALAYHDNYRPVPTRFATHRGGLDASGVLELSIVVPCIISFAAFFGNSAVNNFALAFGEQRAIAGMGLFFSVFNVAVVIMRMLAGRLQDLIASRRIITLGILSMGAGTLLIALSHGIVGMFVAAVLIGVGFTLHSQYLQAEIMLRVPKERRGVANSTLMLAQDMGTGTGAVGFGVISEALGYAVTFVVAALATWSVLPLCVWGHRHSYGIDE